MMNIKHTEAFDLAYRFVTETNLNIFLTGKAGTGKTTFLKYLRENSFKKMVIAAPTGVAAINAGGVTLHSLFQLPFAPFVPSKINNGDALNSHTLLSQIRFSKEKRNILRNLELLVIDEASMVASHTVDAFDTILRSVRRRHQLPFGGAQVLFIGDLHQLQPVVKNHEWNFLKEYYPSIFFFDSLVLRENVPVMIELKEIFRQKDNSFIEVLNEIRHNNLTTENLELLNSRLRKNFIPEEDGYITLTTHNNQADYTNKEKLKKLSARSQIYRASVQGDFSENLFPSDYELELKEGAQVMFLKNDTEGKKYFNGKIGIITKLGEELIKVKCENEAEEIEVKKYEWKNMNYALNEDTREITETELGSFTQYPLRLAWAITIHKSQGLTFEKAIIDAENAFANGQVYVALSRCTSLEGLILTSPVNRTFLGAHVALKDWQEKNNDEENLSQKFNESRQKYAQQELQNIFTWTNWYFELRDLKVILDEHKEDLPAECFNWIKELTEKEKVLSETAGKFKAQVASLCNENGVVEENELLQKRIKDAANYFSDEIKKWKELFCAHSLSTDTKKVSRKVDASLNEINFIIHEILFKLNYCRNGFALEEYLKKAKKFTEAVPEIQSSYAQSQSKTIVTRETSHKELYEALAEMRKRIGRETGFPLFRIFSNKAITNVCEQLPADVDSLLKVNGFGKTTVKNYGAEIIELVHDYCEDNNLSPQEIFKSEKRERKSKAENQTPTIYESIKLFKLGKSVSQIAAERNLVAGTIESHLAAGVRIKMVDIEELMPLKEAKEIAKHFSGATEPIQFGLIKQNAGDVSYGKLKIVFAWLQSQKES